MLQPADLHRRASPSGPGGRHATMLVCAALLLAVVMLSFRLISLI
jgi:hypothetical protein